jgi:hypothetical protein
MVRFRFQSRLMHKFRRLLLAIFAVLAGAALGYLHYSPIVSLPLEPSVVWMAPYLKGVDAYFSSLGAQYVVVALVLFILAIPNIVVVALVVSGAMKLLRHPRTVFYFTFIWPALAYLAYWLDVLHLKSGAQRLGLPSDIEHLPTDPSFPGKAISFLLIYSLYTLLVVVIFRFMPPAKHKDAAQ